MKVDKKNYFSTFQIIIWSFLFVILLGAFLLMLPCSTRGTDSASFLDALFTSTSAVCVTGLAIHDTATYWSTFGQSVILLLIQIGGMGVVTVAAFIPMVSGRKIGLMQRSTMQEAIAAPQMGGIVRLTKFILKITVLVELLGAIIMFPVFYQKFGGVKGVWYAVFHSISAFCNAGFDLMGIKTPFSSLTSYSANPVISLAISFLIITGGIGFLTWDDIATNKWHFKRYRMQSKVILTVTGALILLPALYFYCYEFSQVQWDGISKMERALSALFQSVTPRTAGFNTVDLTSLSETGQTILIVLMLTGGSPGSTAGGMKTTTVAVLLLTAISVFRRRENACCFGRRISNDAIRNAATVFLLYLLLFLFGGILISCIEGLPVLSCLFEAASAIGTVGLSLGITTQLGAASRLILIGLMYFGRVGGLTLIFATLSGSHPNISKLPQEMITIG
ncbi:MAG: TrkH family potassium uptake protein [Oscillospiraceae bacterium]